jgi:drug/metabolite transporter (DMT)-like permease
VIDLPAAAPHVHGRRDGLVLLAVSSVVWGANWPVVKSGLAYMPPLTYASLRLIVGTLTMVAFLGVTRRLVRPSRADWPIIASIGSLQVAAGVIIMSLALLAVPAGRSSVLVFTTPLWVALILRVAFRTRLRPLEIAGLALGIAGILVLVNPTVINWAVPAELGGTLALTGNAFMVAIVTIHIRRHRWVSTPLLLQPWILGVAIAPVTIVAVLLEQGQPIRWEPATLFYLVYSGVLATAFANYASQSATRALGPISSSTGHLAAPVVGLVCGALFLHEALGMIDVLGFGLVLAGIAATSVLSPTASQQARPTV